MVEWDIISKAKADHIVKYVHDHPDEPRSRIFREGKYKNPNMEKRLIELIDAGLIEAYPGGKIKGRDVLRHRLTPRGEQVFMLITLMEQV